MVVSILLDLALDVSWWVVKKGATGLYYGAEATYSWVVGQESDENSQSDALETACVEAVPERERRHWMLRSLFEHNTRTLLKSKKFQEKGSFCIVFLDRCGRQPVAQTPPLTETVTVDELRQLLRSVDGYLPRLEGRPWHVEGQNGESELIDGADVLKEKWAGPTPTAAPLQVLVTL